MKNSEEDREGEELRAIAPLLFGIPKENGFSVPDGYFENLTRSILERYPKEEKRFFLWKWVRWIFIPSTEPAFRTRLALAGLIVLLAGTAVLYFTAQPAKRQMEYVFIPESILSDLVDEYMLAEALSDADFPVMQPDSTGTDHLQIEEYLLNENIDVTLISPEL